MRNILGYENNISDLLEQDLSLDTVNINNLLIYSPITTITGSVANALTPVQVINAMIERTYTGTVAITDTLPSAADLISFLGNVQLNDSFSYNVKSTNNSSQSCGIGPGTGGTAGTFTTYSAGSKSMASFRLVFTNVNAGSEAYVIYRDSFVTGAFA